MRFLKIQWRFIFPLLSFVFLHGCIMIPEGVGLSGGDVVELNKKQAGEYRLAPGDRIAIKFFYINKLNDEVVIRPDGKISLQLIDDVTAAGLTPQELDKNLTESYARIFRSSPSSYTLGIGDRLVVKSFYYNKLNEEVVIRPDGKISLQLIDDVTATGLTPEELDVVLTEKYSRYLDTPDISIIVRDFTLPDLSIIVQQIASQKIYIGGEVNRPGIIPLQGRVRVLDAVFQAGGTSDTAKLSTVILLRRTDSGDAEVYTVNLESVISGQHPDVDLRPYDIVYIPKTNMAQVSTFLRQSIYSLIPSQVLYSLTYNTNPEVEIK